MSVIGALVNRYNSDSDSEIVSLRSAVGVGKMWRSKVPDAKLMPYVALTDAGQSLDDETTQNSCVFFTSRIQVECWSNSAEQVESTLDLLESAYVGKPLTITGKSFLTTRHGGGRIVTSFEKSYRGMFELLVSYYADWS